MRGAVGLSAAASVALHAAMLALAVVALPSPERKAGTPRVAFDVEDVAGARSPDVAPPPAPSAAAPVKHAPARPVKAAPRASAAAVAVEEAPVPIEGPTGTETTAEPSAPAPGTGAPGGPAGPSSISAPDPNAIRAAIAQSIRYPRLARSQGLEGQVTVRFHVDAAGAPSDITIVSSAGELLDSAAREAVTRASPYRSPPGWVRVPVIFSLHDAR